MGLDEPYWLQIVAPPSVHRCSARGSGPPSTGGSELWVSFFYTTAVQGGSGQWVSFSRPPHCEGSGQWASFSTIRHYRGQWVVGSKLLSCTAGGSGSWASFSTLQNTAAPPGVVGRGDPSVHCSTAGGRGQLVLFSTLPHGAGGSGDVVRCGYVWCGVVWCGVEWHGVAWIVQCGVVRNVVWCGVVWCVVWWLVRCGVVWCAEGTVTRRQRPGCLPTGTGKREGCVCCARAVCECVDTAGARVRGTGTWRLLIRLFWSAQ